MIDEEGTALGRIEDALRERVPPTPAGLHDAVVARLEDLPADRSGSVARRSIGAVGAAAGRPRLALAAAVLLAAGIVLAARLTRAALLGWVFTRPVRRAVPAPRSGAGAASR